MLKFVFITMASTQLTVLVNFMLMFGERVSTLDNGVALTPPMGFIHWERFECNTNCDIDPANCVSENLFKMVGDIYAKEGYKDAGWEFVVMGDCWLAQERDSQGKLQPDPKRFPSGIPALVKFMHQRGLKFGLYEDVGSKTCAGFPGSEGHYETDAQTFADWGLDFLKFDGCNADIPQYHTGFPEMARALNKTGRHIVYSCEWPMYEKAKGGKPDYQLIANTCNVFRQLTDIYDSWGSVYGMVSYFGDDPGNFSQVAGPGAWNDPDQVVIGNFGLSHDQERVQMAMYAMLASPMFMSVDLRSIRNSSKAILLNKRVIAINQDKLGIQGRRIKKFPNMLSYWTRPVTPKGSYAIAFLYAQQYGYPIKVSVRLQDLGLSDSRGYNVTELFDGLHLGMLKPTQNISCFVNPTGVYMVKAEVMASRKLKKERLFRHRF